MARQVLAGIWGDAVDSRFGALGGRGFASAKGAESERASITVTAVARMTRLYRRTTHSFNVQAQNHVLRTVFG